jgi:amino acid transporter
MKAVFLLIFAYGGFESALAPTGEARNPARDMAFALFIALASCTLIYAVVQWVVVGVLGPVGTIERPLAEVARVAMGARGAALVSIGALVSVYGYLSAKMLGMPRVTFALAEQGDLPSFFGAVGKRFQAPWVSILVFAAAVWILALIGNFAWNVTLSVIARLFYYGVVCASLIALRREPSRGAGFRLPAGPVWAVLGVLITAALVTQADMSKWIILTVTVIVAVLNWLWARQRESAA